MIKGYAKTRPIFAHRGGHEKGFVTVELAVGIFSLAILMGGIGVCISAGMTRSSLCQASREAARSLAVGEENPRGVAEYSFGRTLSVDTSSEGKWVHVKSSATPRGLPFPLNVTCEVTTLREQSV